MLAKPGLMQAMGIRVVAVAVGPVGRPPKFGWAGFDAPAREPCGSGDDPQTAVSALVAGLAWGRQAALLLESPLSVGAWMLRHLAEAVPALSATTQAGLWQSGAARLLLAEPLVPAAGRLVRLAAGQHAAGAAAAGLALVDLLGTAGPLATQVRCSPHGSFNLLAAMALWAGLSIDPQELSQNVLVIAPRQRPGQ